MKQERKLIELFPDYCSTGLWEPGGGCNLDPAELGISQSLQMLLKYWHKYWELNLENDVWTDKADRPPDPYWRKRAIAIWVADSYELARLLTNDSDKYTFQYKE